MGERPLHFVLAGGGTGGHLFPGVAVAEQIVARVAEARITFAGTGAPLEQRNVNAAGFEYLALPSRPWPNRLSAILPFMIRNLAGYCEARRFLHEHRVDAVVGLGGYGSVPMARAAAGLGIPLILLEQNAVPGKATRWLAGSAALICAAMDSAAVAKLRSRCPVQVTGNPIRRDFGLIQCSTGAAAFHELHDSNPRRLPCGGGRVFCMRETGGVAALPVPRHQLLILGGSSGARALNENVPRALSQLRAELRDWRIVHQSGEQDFEATCQRYRRAGMPVTVASFIADMPEVLAASDLAVSRAGGTTLAELAAAGVPAVLMPYPHAAENHQRRNADVFSSAAAAVTIDSRELPSLLDRRLATTLRQLLADPDRRYAMSCAMRGLARPTAAADVAALVLQAVGAACSRYVPARQAA